MTDRIKIEQIISILKINISLDYHSSNSNWQFHDWLSGSPTTDSCNCTYCSLLSCMTNSTTLSIVWCMFVRPVCHFRGHPLLNPIFTIRFDWHLQIRQFHHTKHCVCKHLTCTYLAVDSWPYFQCVVIWTTDHSRPVEF